MEWPSSDCHRRATKIKNAAANYDYSSERSESESLNHPRKQPACFAPVLTQCAAPSYKQGSCWASYILSCVYGRSLFESTLTCNGDGAFTRSRFNSDHPPGVRQQQLITKGTRLHQYQCYFDERALWNVTDVGVGKYQKSCQTDVLGPAINLMLPVLTNV